MGEIKNVYQVLVGKPEANGVPWHTETCVKAYVQITGMNAWSYSRVENVC